MGITFGIQRADLVVPGAQIAFRPADYIALGCTAAAEHSRLAMPQHFHGLLAHDPLDHLLNQVVDLEKNPFGTYVAAQRLLEIDVILVQAIAAAQGSEHRAAVSELDKVLRRTIVPSKGRVGQVENHGRPWAPDRFGDQIAPMRHEDPLGMNRSQSLRRELGGCVDAFHAPITPDCGGDRPGCCSRGDWRSSAGAGVRSHKWKPSADAIPTPRAMSHLVHRGNWLGVQKPQIISI